MRWRNTVFKTGLLLAGITALFVFVGALIGGEQGMMVALLFALAGNFFTYWYSDRMLLKLYRARPLEAGELAWLQQGLEQMANRAQLPTPRLYVMDNQQPNAFATGRNPAHSAIAVTTGLLNMLDRREVLAVVGHELGHVRNYDTLIMTVTATLAGAISTLGNFALFFGSAHRNDGSRANPFAVLMVAMLAPFAAMLVQMAISRTREYGADAAAAELSGDPMALASALEKISQLSQRIVNHEAERNPATAHLFIVSPLHVHRIDNLFSTHPAPQNRIEALRRLAQSMEKQMSALATTPVRVTKRGSFKFSRKNQLPL